MRRVWSCALLSVVACGNPARPAVTNEPSDVPAIVGIPTTTPGCPELPAEPTVESPGARVIGLELVAAGEAPRQVLRYAPAGGARACLELSVVIDLDNGSGPMPMPVTTSHVVHDVQPSGADAIEHRFVLEDSEVTSRGLPPEGDAAVDEQLDQSRCGSLTIRTDTRGQSRGTTLTGTTASAAQLLQLFEELLPALPDQAVGVGASWTVTTSQIVGGVELDVMTDVELLQLDGDTVTLSAAITGKAEPQTVTMGGVAMDVTKLLLARLVELTIDLRSLRIEGASRGGILMEASGGTDNVKLQLQTAVTVRPE